VDAWWPRRRPSIDLWRTAISPPLPPACLLAQARSSTCPVEGGDGMIAMAGHVTHALFYPGMHTVARRSCPNHAAVSPSRSRSRLRTDAGPSKSCLPASWRGEVMAYDHYRDVRGP